ncbi:MAG: response regulator [Burkholderiales bacterium]
MNSTPNRPPSLLMVDDNAALLDQFALRLMRCGFAVTAADSVASATNALERFVPDVLLLDFFLGDGTARDILQSSAMRAHHAVGAFQPVVVWSSESDAEEVQSLKREGLVNEILDKSTDTQELFLTLARYVAAAEALNLTYSEERP